MEYFDLVEQECPAPTGSAAFDFSSSGALTGRFTFDARLTTTGQTCGYTARDSSGNVETGLGTWDETAKTLTRTTIYASTNGDAAESFSGTVTVAMDWLAKQATQANIGAPALIPGGRLTLDSADPIPSSDQTAKTTVYYLPYKHNIVSLWDGTGWSPTEFTSASLALGTITSGLPYDVFAYLSGGALTLEKLAWASASARATGISVQDGRYCKTGDKTRLYLGTFYTASTTTTEDSVLKRYLWNMYNRAARGMTYESGAASHSYTTGSWRYFNNSSAAQLQFVVGLEDAVVPGALVAFITGGSGKIGAGLNSSSWSGQFNTRIVNGDVSSAYVMHSPSLGHNYVALLEYGAASATFDYGGLYGSIQA